jgi:hypothetical protein
MIKRAPMKIDPPGKCSRRHVGVDNKETKKWLAHRSGRGWSIRDRSYH